MVNSTPSRRHWRNWQPEPIAAQPREDKETTGPPAVVVDSEERIRRYPLHKPAFTFAGRGLAALALLAILSTSAFAQDRYRAEVVILERLADPLLQENMAGKMPEPISSDRHLWVVDEAGNRISDLNLTSNLTLNNSTARLENSGKYRVLMKAGWIQEFPQNYNGRPLAIELGDYLSAAGHRAIEGTIEINRRRFLLVTVALNHWREASRAHAPSVAASSPEDQGPATEDNADSDRGGLMRVADDRSARPEPANKELVTWIRETRRMRSQEIHFVDSPTIGVLIYFRPLD